MNSLCVILARKGSKGIKNKNIINLCEKPLIAYTIEAAVKSKVFDKVVVSTDCENIAKIARSFGAETPFLRPSRLGGDSVLSKHAVQHALKKCEEIYNKKFDIVTELQCTSPLRDHLHVMSAFEKFKNVFDKYDSLVSVYEVNHFHPKKLKKVINDTIVDLCEHYSEEKIGRRQDAESFYVRNGAIFMMTRDCILNKNSRVGDKSTPFIMKEIDSINIDSEIDLKIAKTIIGEKNG